MNPGFKKIISQSFMAAGAVILTAVICSQFPEQMGYRVVAFILLLVMSFLAVVFDILPVLLAAILSALIWDYFFIPPRFTIRVGSTEDIVLLSMYFVIAMINAVLTLRIRQIEKKARLREEKANTLKLYKTLFNSLSHELKTPIATIIGATDTLTSGSGQLNEANRSELLRQVSIASLRLNRQVENLLNMSRLESGFIGLHKDWCDINETIHTVTGRLQESLKPHPVIFLQDASLPLFRIDIGLMEQILHNLLLNAASYTPEHADIIIRAACVNERVFNLETDNAATSKVKDEQSYLVVEVEDRGSGFPPAEIDKVFDKFYRLRNSKTGGTGLGLSIVKGFVEAQDGTVALENIPDGARFTIRIPAEVTYLNNLKNE